MSPVPRTWTLDWSIGSIGLSVAGAVVSVLHAGLFPVGMILFALGLIAGLVALRKGVRRNLAIIGILLNAANLAYNAAVVILSASH